MHFQFMKIYKIYSGDFFPLPLKVNTELWHHLPIIKTLITTLTKFPKTDDNYKILAFEYEFMRMLRGSSIFFFFL